MDPTGSEQGMPGSATESELQGRVGTLINERYRVLRLIGHGSTGAVYACQHVGLDKLVALKILHREMEENASFVERFKLEARAASRLEHTNSVRVLDFGQDLDSGVLFIAMEYIEGRDLLQVLEEDGPFTAERAVNVMAQILDVLGVAHGLGIVHRDLKPENILLRSVESDGVSGEHVTVCDFGIAQFGGRRSGAPEAAGSPDGEDGLVAGTPAYMSPEQARAEPQDARSDVYSAGVVLYQLLTLQLPFYADDAYSLALKHCVEVPPPPSRFGAVSPQLEDICLKALSKSRDARYQSAREMRLALQRVLMATPEAAVPVDGVGRQRRWGLPRQIAPQATPSDAPAVETQTQPSSALAAASKYERLRRWSVILGAAAVCLIGAGALFSHNAHDSGARRSQMARLDTARSAEAEPVAVATVGSTGSTGSTVTAIGSAREPEAQDAREPRPAAKRTEGSGAESSWSALTADVEKLDTSENVAKQERDEELDGLPKPSGTRAAAVAVDGSHASAFLTKLTKVTKVTRKSPEPSEPVQASDKPGKQASAASPGTGIAVATAMSGPSGAAAAKAPAPAAVRSQSTAKAAKGATASKADSRDEPEEHEEHHGAGVGEAKRARVAAAAAGAPENEAEGPRGAGSRDSSGNGVRSGRVRGQRPGAQGKQAAQADPSDSEQAQAAAPQADGEPDTEEASTHAEAAGAGKVAQTSPEATKHARALDDLEFGLLPDDFDESELLAAQAAVTATKHRPQAVLVNRIAQDSAAGDTSEPELPAAPQTAEVQPDPAPAKRAPAPEPNAARVSILKIISRSGVSKQSVRSALNLSAITDCYRSAIRGGGISGARITGELELATSQNGSVIEASLSAPTLPSALRQCVEQIARRGRVREADTGNAQATITLAFLPR